MQTDFNLIGKRIASIRKKQGYTQAQLAEKANITNNFLSHVERSHSIPSLETLINICNALAVTPNEILLGVAAGDKEYLNSDIEFLLMRCTPKQKRFFVSMIENMLKEKLE